MEQLTQKTKFLALVCLSVVVVAGLSLAIYHGSANAQYKTTIEHTGKDIANSTKANIILVHGTYADALQDMAILIISGHSSTSNLSMLLTVFVIPLSMVMGR
jgi:hypothetical protein